MRGRESRSQPWQGVRSLPEDHPDYRVEDGEEQGHSEALILLRGEWRKLHPTSRTKKGHLGTRIVAIPISLLRRLGFDRDDEIYGRWPGETTAYA